MRNNCKGRNDRETAIKILNVLSPLLDDIFEKSDYSITPVMSRKDGRIDQWIADEAEERSTRYHHIVDVAGPHS